MGIAASAWTALLLLAGSDDEIDTTPALLSAFDDRTDMDQSSFERACIVRARSSVSCGVCTISKCIQWLHADAGWAGRETSGVRRSTISVL